MAIQDFTAGQILTAAQMDSLQANDYNQTVSTKTASYTLVAADKGTRVVMNSASATTITVNTSLFNAGDTLYLQNIGAGVCTVTAGTATVSSAGPLAIPQNGSGTLYFTSAGVSIYYPSAVTASAGGLTLITTTSFSAVSAQTLDSIFTSTYENYKIILEMTTCTNQTSCEFRFRSSGSTISTNDYSYGETRYNWNSAGFGAYDYGVNVSKINNGETASSQPIRIEAEVFSPQSSNKPFVFAVCANNAFGLTTQGFVNLTTAFDGFTVYPGAGTFTGTVYVYGA